MYLKAFQANLGRSLIGIKTEEYSNNKLYFGIVAFTAIVF